MYELIMRGWPFEKDEYYEVQMNVNGKIVDVPTFGAKVNSHPVYSATLKKLLMRCLAFEATMRPKPDELLGICEQAVQVVDKMEKDPKMGARVYHEWWEHGIGPS